MMPMVYVVIVNYRNWNDVAECLTSLFEMSYSDYKIFVVDNNSGNQSLEHLMQWAEKNGRQDYGYLNNMDFDASINIAALPKINFIQNAENGGFAAGNNVVLKRLIHEDGFIWLLNPDMVAQNDALLHLVEFAKQQPLRSIIGTTVKRFHDPATTHFYGGARVNFNSATIDFVKKKKNISQLDFISGGSLFTYAKNFAELGLLPESYFLYWEETDWCYRAKQNGFQLLVCTDAVCFDKISTTIGKNFLSDYYYTLNGLRFTKIYRKDKMPLVLLSAWMRFFKRVVQGRWDRSKGVYKGIRVFLNQE